MQTPLHLDIPYVAASIHSHSNTLASIEHLNTPRSNYGPLSEAGKAIVAARKDSMRQEHLAAIAQLNTFAQKHAAKGPSPQSSGNQPPICYDHAGSMLTKAAKLVMRRFGTCFSLLNLIKALTNTSSLCARPPSKHWQSVMSCSAVISDMQAKITSLKLHAETLRLSSTA